MRLCSFVFRFLVIAVLFCVKVDAELLDKIVANVDGAPVSESEIVSELKKISPESSLSIPLTKDQLKLGLMTFLLNKEASRLGVTVSEEDVDHQVAQVIKQNNISEDQFEQSLAEAGMTLAEYRSKLQAELNKSRVLSSVLRQRIQVSDEELSSYLGISEAEDDQAFGLLKLTLLVQDFNRSEEEAKLEDFLKLGGSCGKYQSSIFSGCENLGVFKKGDLKELYAKSLADRSKYNLSDVFEENERHHVLFKVDPKVAARSSDLAQDIQQKLFNEKFQVEAQKFLDKEIFEKYMVETHF